MLKKTTFFLIFILLNSCSLREKETIQEKIFKIKSSNFKLFEGIRATTWKTRDGVYEIRHFYKTVDGRGYFIPNFNYFDSLDLLEDSKEQQSRFFSFSRQQGILNDTTGYQFIKKYSDSVITEYEKINIHKILTNPEIGECIIFYPKPKEFIAYVPDTSKVYNKYWKERFILKNQIEENWYAVQDD